MSDKPFGTFHDASTGETVTRELTDEEYAEFLASAEPVPTEP